MRHEQRTSPGADPGMGKAISAVHNALFLQIWRASKNVVFIERERMRLLSMSMIWKVSERSSSCP